MGPETCFLSQTTRFKPRHIVSKDALLEFSYELLSSGLFNPTYEIYQCPSCGSRVVMGSAGDSTRSIRRIIGNDLHD